jgi:acyl-coenzyme A thioesterase PaaI-like protein
MSEKYFPIVYGGPESIFRVEDLRIESGIARGSTPVGEWLTGPDGRVALGALGVFIDDILGYACIAPQPPGRWSVSTDITLDVFPTLQLPTTRLFAEAEGVHADERGCFAIGRVVNDDGIPVAVCSQRGRYVSQSWTATDAVVSPSAAPVGTTSVAGLIGASVADGVVSVTALERLQNPMRIMHGGISLCASDLVAALAVAGEPALTTSSIRMVYARPVPAGATIEFRADAVHRGRSLGIVEIVGSIDGKPCTRAQVTAHPA